MSPEKTTRNIGLPKYEGNWQKFRKLAPAIAPGWEETLDSITVFWRDSAPQEQAKLQRFSSALLLKTVPKLEKKDAQAYFDDTKRGFSKFVDGISSVASDDKLKWAEVELLANHVEDIRLRSNQNDQAIALLEAISETAELKLTPEEIRKRIAQATFDEIFLVGTHRILEYTAVDSGDELVHRSTQDSLEVEKYELISTIRSQPWNAKEKKEATKTYRAWRRVILSDDNTIDPDNAYDQLEELWNATRGQGITRKSALHFLQLGEDIYREIESGGAFDIDLTEFYDDHEDED